MARSKARTVPEPRLRHASVLVATFLVATFVASDACAQRPAWNFERAYESADIVCVADLAQYLPADEPTWERQKTEAAYRFRVLRLWKGSVPPTLQVSALHGRTWRPDSLRIRNPYGESIWLMTEQPQVEVGERYVLFLWQSRTRRLRMTEAIPLPVAHATLLQLQRTYGPGRVIAYGLPDVPTISFRSIVRQLVEGDSASSIFAARSLAGLSDSAGVGVKTLEATLLTTTNERLRASVALALGRWSLENRQARKACARALAHDDPEVRLAVTTYNAYEDADKRRRDILPRITDTDARVRAAALTRCGGLLRGRNSPTREFLHALSDSVRSVRLAALNELGRVHNEPEVQQAVTALLDDADRIVAEEAQQALQQWRESDQRRLAR